MHSYENPLLNVGFNIVIPSLLLTYLPFHPAITILIAISFPIGYGIYDRIVRRQINFISAIGLVSVLLTGGIGLLHLDAQWIAIKEAAVPLAIAIFVFVSAFTRDPIIKALLFTEAFLDVRAISERIEERGEKAEFERTFKVASHLLALSFIFSTVVNYVLARIIVTAPSGTALFNEQIGKMTFIGFGVISVPMMILMILIGLFIIRKLERLTGLGWEDLIAKHGPHPHPSGDDEKNARDDEPDKDPLEVSETLAEDSPRRRR